MSKERLFQLAAKADEQLHQFYTSADDEQRRGTSLPRIAARGAAAVGAGAGAAYGGGMLRNAVINSAGAVDDYGNLVARKGMYGTAAGKAAKQALNSPAAETAKKGARKGLKYVGGKLLKTAGGNQGIVGKAGMALRKASRAFSRADLDRIVELAARVSELETREFGEAPPEKIGWARNRVKRTNAVAATGAAAATGYAAGKYGAQGVAAAKKYGKQGAEAAKKGVDAVRSRIPAMLKGKKIAGYLR